MVDTFELEVDKYLKSLEKERIVPPLKGSLFEEQKLRPWEYIKKIIPESWVQEEKPFKEQLQTAIGKIKTEVPQEFKQDFAYLASQKGLTDILSASPMGNLIYRWVWKPYETWEARKEKPATWLRDAIDLTIATIPIWLPEAVSTLTTKKIAVKISPEKAIEIFKKRLPETTLPPEAQTQILTELGELYKTTAPGEPWRFSWAQPRWQFMRGLVSTLPTPGLEVKTIPTGEPIPLPPAKFKQLPPIPSITTIPIIPTGIPYKVGQPLWNLDTGQKAKVTRIDDTGTYIKFEGAVKEIKLKPGEEALFTTKKPKAAEVVVEKLPKEISLEEKYEDTIIDETITELEEADEMKGYTHEEMRDILKATIPPEVRKPVSYQIKERGGIRSYKDKDLLEEYRNVPPWLRNRNGLPLDEMADELGMTEVELLQALRDENLRTESSFYSGLPDLFTEEINQLHLPPTITGEEVIKKDINLVQAWTCSPRNVIPKVYRVIDLARTPMIKELIQIRQNLNMAFRGIDRNSLDDKAIWRYLTNPSPENFAALSPQAQGAFSYLDYLRKDLWKRQGKTPEEGIKEYATYIYDRKDLQAWGKLLIEIKERTGIEVPPPEQTIPLEIPGAAPQPPRQLFMPYQEPRVLEEGKRILIAKLAEFKAKHPETTVDDLITRTKETLVPIESAIEMANRYIPQALRKIYLQPAITKAAELVNELPSGKRAYAIDWLNLIAGRPTRSQIFGKGITPKISNSITRLYYNLYLGLAIDSTLKNLTQPIYTGARIGFYPTVQGYLGLLKTYLPPFRYSEAAKALRAEIKEEALLEPMNELLERDPFIKNALDKLENINLSVFQFGEAINRGATYLGARWQIYHLAKELPEVEQHKLAMDIVNRAARDYAREINKETQFEYGVMGTSPYLRDSLIRPFIQFATFPLKSIEMMYSWKKQRLWWPLIKYFALTGLATYGVREVFDIDLSTVFGKPWNPMMIRDLIGFEPPILRTARYAVDRNWKAMVGGLIPRYPAKIMKAIQAAKTGEVRTPEPGITFPQYTQWQLGFRPTVGMLQKETTPFKQLLWALGIRTEEQAKEAEERERLFGKIEEIDAAYDKVKALTINKLKRTPLKWTEIPQEAWDLIHKYKLYYREGAFDFRNFQRAIQDAIERREKPAIERIKELARE